MTEPKRNRQHCCTKNNYTSEDVDALHVFANEKCTYLVYGEEAGSLNNTPHLQIYFELKDAMTYSALNKKLFRAHYEKRRALPKQAAGYCMKGEMDASPTGDYSYYFDNPHDTWIGEQFGEISSQGKRSDLDGPAELIAEGGSLEEVAEQYPVQFIKYNQGLLRLRQTLLKPRKLDAMPEVIVLHGPTGTGKTRDAYLKYWPDVPHYLWKPSNGNWWDGYDGQDKVIIDEFRGQMPWSDILGLLDRNEFRAQVKGAFVNVVASKFVITSPFPPSHWYRDDSRYDRFAQLERRITEVVPYQ